MIDLIIVLHLFPAGIAVFNVIKKLKIQNILLS